MFKALSDMKKDVLVNEQGGAGEIEALTVFTKEELSPYLKMFKKLSFDPGDSIGEHTHHGEMEIYYVTEGEATVTENGNQRILKEGEAAFCYDNMTHKIENLSDKPMSIIAIIAENP